LLSSSIQSGKDRDPKLARADTSTMCYIQDIHYSCDPGCIEKGRLKPCAIAKKFDQGRGSTPCTVQEVEKPEYTKYWCPRCQGPWMDAMEGLWEDGWSQLAKGAASEQEIEYLNELREGLDETLRSLP
jgi:hypothetical protein